MEILKDTNDPDGQESSQQLSEETALQLLKGLWALTHTMKRQLGPMLLREHGLEFKDFLALQAIEEGSNYPGQLCQRLTLTPSNASRLIDALVDSALIERRLDDQDARRVQLTLTAKGEKVLAATYSTLLDLFRRSLGELSDAQIAEFTRTLALLSQTFGSTTPAHEDTRS
ncbi:MarR family winged helix-turn-helix transcriptional regulator [Deinococcus ruber]|uniref:HTH marR-type domain-containing protein n=1 Tax=Deinococcus ruber TaxID=1848197 RepID=A0A918C2Y3_9DEIO|nr:MarR family winged helix-turn-helix transcriptional regulator [Deinococcus ruber]GGR03056.1 hypothetical protein GCM10008957_14870 [Deinococcus ruber]